MYCSVEDAWGSDFNKHNTNTTESEESKTSSISSVNSREEYRTFIKLKEKFGQDTDSLLCTQTMTHINKCKVCQEKIKEMYSSNNTFNINSISRNIMDYIKDNNDAVTLILICFLIVLLVKLFIS